MRDSYCGCGTRIATLQIKEFIADMAVSELVRTQDPSVEAAWYSAQQLGKVFRPGLELSSTSARR